jgi:Activator of Hsp90 ATPase homolog 1-like protein
MSEGLRQPLASVIRTQPPPVRQSTLVRSDVTHTFDVFVRRIGVWWPTNPASAGGSRTRDVTVETELGGRVYETWDDGTTVEWGRVLSWQPPTRFAMSWVLTPEPTEVELTFTGLGPRLTRVTVEHRGWEALTDEQLREDCAAPGGYSSGAYSRGWAFILSRLAACAAGEPLTDGQPFDRPTPPRV